MALEHLMRPMLRHGRDCEDFDLTDNEMELLELTMDVFSQAADLVENVLLYIKGAEDAEGNEIHAS